jgi:Cytidylate kinase
MIIWINGAFGSGKTTTAYELHRRLRNSHVFDPENFGYFIRKNAPASFSRGDFQDLPIWRETNYRLLKMIHAEHVGDIIVPMTLVDDGYYAEIVTRLRDDGVDVRHFIIYAGKDEIMRRLRGRSLGFLREENFAVKSIDRCIRAFDTTITETKIDTENAGVDEVVEKIADMCALTLTAGRKSAIGRFLYRLGVQLRHIRL